MVKALASYRTDQTLYVGVLPGRARGRWSVPNTQRSQTPPRKVAINGVSISHQVSRHHVPWEGLAHLPRNPLGRWMRRSLAMPMDDGVFSGAVVEVDTERLAGIESQARRAVGLPNAEHGGRLAEDVKR